VETIAKPPPAPEALIFAYRHRRHIADTPMGEVAHAGVMHGMGALPMIVRRQREDADDPPDPIIGRAATEEGPMAAVMLDHEEADEKPGRGNRKDEAEQWAEREDR